MTTMYLMHKKTGKVGIADLPNFVNFDEQPPRSFRIRWSDYYGEMPCNTGAVVPITKEVYDIARSV